MEKSAEAIVVRDSGEAIEAPASRKAGTTDRRSRNEADEGPNLLMQGAVRETRWTQSDSKAEDVRATFSKVAVGLRASAQAVTAAPELPRARSRRRPRRGNGNEP